MLFLIIGSQEFINKNENRLHFIRFAGLNIRVFLLGIFDCFDDIKPDNYDLYFKINDIYQYRFALCQQRYLD